MARKRSQWYQGGPPGDAQYGGSGGVPGLFNPIARLPNWMRETLGLTSDDLPNRLRVDQVVPALEFGQSGWGFAEYFPVTVNLTSASPVTFPPELPISQTEIRRMISIRAFTDAAVAVGMRIRLDLEALGLAGGFQQTLLTETALPPTPDQATTADVSQGIAIVQPPGTRIGFQDFSLAGAELMTIDMIWVKFPVGYPLPL